MSLFRTMAGVLAGVVLVITVSAGVFLLTLDANRYKPELISLVKHHTGRDLTLAGSVSLSLYPAIALEVNQARLGNAVGFREPYMATAQNVRVAVQLWPLLRNQQLRIQEVTLQGVRLNLQRKPNGVPNWADLLPSGITRPDEDAGQVLAKLLGGLVVAGISVQDAAVHWQDEYQGKTLVLEPLDIRTGLLRPGKPVAIEVVTRVQQAQPALDLQLHATTTATLAENQADFTLERLDIQAQDETLKAVLSGNLQGNLARQQLLMPDLQARLTLPSQGEAYLSGQLQADLLHQQLRLQSVQGKGNFSHPATGRADVEVKNAQVKLDLAGKQGLIELPEIQATLLEQALTGHVQVQNPLAHPVVTGEFRADTFRYPPLELQQAVIGVQMADQLLTLLPRGKLYQGDYNASLRWQTQAKPPVIQMQHTVKGLHTDELLLATVQDKLVTGLLDLDAELDSVTTDAIAFKRNLNGKIGLHLHDGSIRDAGFAQNVKQVVKLFERERVNDLGDKEVAFTTLDGQWQIHQGVFQTRDQLLVAPHFQVQGQGEVDTLNSTLNLKLRVSEKHRPDQPSGAFAPLHVHGPWKDPQYALELDVLLKEMGEQALEKQRDKLKDRLEDQLKEKLQKQFGIGF